MGLVRTEPSATQRTKELVLAVQRDLWILMAELAAPAEVRLTVRLEEERTAWLEAETDKLGAEFPPLKSFVIPGDTVTSAWLDVARAVVRRAERGAARLWHEGHLENGEVLRYLNRLSSLLFALARYEEFVARGRSTLVNDVA
jgi:cob(I)alamin adenosyltransferase